MFILVILLSLSSVSAEDTNYAVDNKIEDFDISNSESIEIYSTEEMSETEGNFTELTSLITSASSDATITLDKDYKCKDGENSGIAITQDITINGDGHTIDANNLSTIFTVNSGVTFTLNNITLTNGNATQGGAIFNNGTLILTNVNISNNYAIEGAGIYNNGTANISKSKLDENTAFHRGGAIYSNGTLNIESSSFNKNDILYREENAGYGGAAIFNFYEKLTINNSNFTNNLKNYKERQKIEGVEQGDLINGIIVSYADTTINKSYFYNNSGCYGGAIIVGSINRVVNVLINNTIFESNTAYNGGAIDSINAKLVVDSSKFINNKAIGKGDVNIDNAGGAIVSFYGAATTTITNSYFENNTAYAGGAASIGGKTTISNSTFVNNSALQDGGAVDLDDGEIIISESTFTGNSADRYGGAINSRYALDVDDSTFTNNSAVRGGAIYSSSATNLSDSKFINNTGTSGSAVRTGVLTLDNKTIFISEDSNPIYFNSIYKDINGFEDLEYVISITPSGKTIYLTSNVTIKDDEIDKYKNGIVIDKNFRIDANGYTIDARNSARIFNITSSGNLNLINAILINGNADLGGAIYNEGTLTFRTDPSSFINNTANYGGAIYNKGKITNSFTSGISFINNSALSYGGAIYNEGTVNVNKYLFANNSASSWGGAIYNKGTLTVSNGATFDSNDITNRSSNDLDYGGAAIYSADGTRLIVSGANIINNIKNYKNGDCLIGAIAAFGNVTVTNSYFANNSGRWGAAFSSADYNNQDLVTIIDNCTFIDNRGLYGAGIWSWGTDFSITDSTFDDNTAFGKGNMTPNNNNGGAIAVYGATSTGVISGSTFIGNDAHYGGAIAISENNGVVIKNSTFINNTATVGGAIFAGTSLAGLNEVTVINSTFINNTDDYQGAIVFTEKGNVSDSEFINNGILTNSELTISNNKFESNISDYFVQSSGEGVVIGTELKLSVNTNAISVDKPVEIYVNLTDGSGNVIWEGDGIEITVGDSSKVTAVFDINTNLYKAEYKSDAVGKFNITAQYQDVKDNLTVEFYKAKPTISINGDTTFIENEKFDFTITLNPAINGKVTVIVSNDESKIKEYEFNVTDGVVDYNFSDIKFSQGKYSLNVSFAGDELNEAASNIFTITIKNMLDLTVSADDIVYGNSLTITVSVSEKDATGTVDVTVDGKKYNIKLVNGAGSVAVSNLDAGNYRIIAIYNGDDKYGLASDTIEITVDKANSNINVDVDDIVYSEDAIIEIITNGAGNVDILINDEKYTTVFVDGSKAVNVSDLAIGEYEVTVVFAENDNYKKSQASTTFTVGKETSDININITLTGEDSIIINTTLANDATGNVTLTINGENITAELVNGSHVFNIENLEPGDYEITVYYSGDDKYDPLTVNTTFTVNSTIKLTAEDLVLYYHNGSVFEVLVTNKGEAVADANVTFTVNGVNYTRVTDENGIASITINLNSGNYEIITSYGNQTIKNNVTVLSTIKSDNLIKYFHNDSQFHTQILDGEGNPIENVTVTYNINGVFYNRTTDENGIATLNINLNPGKYIITINNTLNGEKTSNNVTVLPTIKVENLTKYYRNESQFLITVVDNQGNLLANQSVSININGVFYTRTTNEEGIATLNINLNPGVYIATAEDPNNGLMNSAYVTVLPTLTAEDFVMDYRDGSTYNVTLVDGQGNPIANETITMNINGVMYNKVTDNNGIAHLDINLNPGEYIITAYHGNATVSNTITINEI